MANKVIYISILLMVFAVGLLFIDNQSEREEATQRQVPLWNIRSVDTVKYSRDLASQMLNNPDFDAVIDKQVSDIASLGVSHIAIGTPYDHYFQPFLRRWVISARKNNLKVWFRGNFSGWEEWFEYPQISREEHKKLLSEFILNNPDLFEDGDIFTSCPECENGGPGDPRFTGDVDGHRRFLTEEYKISEDSFKQINKKVKSGYYSMNYDVANLIMDEKTTDALGNLIVIDHYIKDPKLLAQDAKKIAYKGKGEVVLGEYGVPIPDIHGKFTEDQQNEWIQQAMDAIKNTPEIVGINYWTNVGGSTGLWNDDGSGRKVIQTLKKYFNETKTIETR